MKVAASASVGYGTEPIPESRAGRRIFVIDDDDLSREVLTLIAREAGFEVESFASGEDALAALEVLDWAPAAILTDMQMPGISGRALAVRLGALCGESTALLAMSGSAVAKDTLGGYDSFLLKPFSADELKAALDRKAVQAVAGAEVGTPVLNEAVFENFARSMPTGQVFSLYKMCLDDSAKRLGTMRLALEAGDDTAYRRAAHAIKGGCGMVGALELAKLAAEMETIGLPAEHNAASIEHFLVASARLKRMLDNKAAGVRANATESPVATTL
jgi:CheY-like chemotaxis protein/HPt (histidine-containing phosphotransfer) domain-containing protein